jgi:hypothetical protein
LQFSSLDLTSLSDVRRRLKKRPESHREVKAKKKSAGSRKDENTRGRSPQKASSPHDVGESDLEELPDEYHQVSIKVGRVVRARSGSCAWCFKHYDVANNILCWEVL